MYLRLATVDRDYRKCLVARPVDEGGRYDFPTIMAERELDGPLEGFLSTNLDQQMIVCGPLWLDSSMGLGRKSRMTIRLLDAYEMILKKAGVSQYLFHVRPEGHWMDTIERALGLKPYEFSEGEFWYKREF